MKILITLSNLIKVTYQVNDKQINNLEQLTKIQLDFIKDFETYMRSVSKISNPDFLESSKMGYKRDEKVPEFFQFFLSNQDTLGFTTTRGLLSYIQDYILNNSSYNFEIEEDYKELPDLEIESKIEKLRDYQTIVEKELNVHNNGHIIVPTGGGKTVIMINEIVKKKKPTLVLVHTTTLLDQFVQRVLDFTSYKKKDIGIYGKGKKNVKHLTIALIQSLSKLDDKEIQELTSEFELFFIDESHHLVANTFMKIVTNVKSKRLYGLTATPYKRDGVVEVFLTKILGSQVYKITEEELVKQGVILKPKLEILVNEDSSIRDMFRDYYKIEDRTIHKYYGRDFIDSKTVFDQRFLPQDRKNETTLVVFDGKIELDNFYKSEYISPYIKSRIFKMENPIFKRNQSVLEKYEVVFCLDTPQEYKRVDMHKIKRDLYYRKDRILLVYKTILNEFQNHTDKDPYILVLSDTVEHLEYMYEHMPDMLKNYSCLLHGKIKKKERDLIEEDIKQKKYRVVLATDKFVGEGWDISGLNILIVTQLMKDHEGLKQLVGRVIRTKEGKTEAKVYDICDINCNVTYSQFRKRYENYYIKQCDISQSVDLYTRNISKI